MSVDKGGSEMTNNATRQKGDIVEFPVALQSARPPLYLTKRGGRFRKG